MLRRRTHTRICPRQPLLRRLHGTRLSPEPWQAWHPSLLRLLRWRTTSLSGPPTTNRLLRTRRAHEKSPTRHAKGIFTMDEIRAAIILDQHLASTTPEARTRRPNLAHTRPLHPLSLDTRSMLGTQVKNNTTTYKAILIAPSDNRNPINLENLYAWVRPLNEPRHKGQSLWIGSTMLRTKIPPLYPPPPNTSPRPPTQKHVPF